jgi:hypothetical protein
MTLGSPDGPAVGFLRRGTRVQAHAQPDGEHALVAARFPPVSAGGGLWWPWDENDGFDPLVVFIDSRIPSAAVVTESPAGQAEVLWGLYRELAARPGDVGFAFVKCGRVRVMERKDGYMRVAAEYSAGELHGWVEAAKPGERDEGCETGLSPSLPLGYRPVFDTSQDLAKLAASRARIFVVARGSGGGTCQEWRFAPRGAPGRGRLIGPQPGPEESDLVRVEWDYGIVGGVLCMTPLRYRRDGGMMTSSAVRFLAVVRLRSDDLEVIETHSSGLGGTSRDRRRPELVGYRASAAERWYLSRDACERSLPGAAATAGAAGPANKLAP